jgi:hypothetical protein
VVETSHRGCNLAPAVKTTAAFTVMDGLAQVPAFHEVQLFDGVVAISARDALGKQTYSELPTTCEVAGFWRWVDNYFVRPLLCRGRARAYMPGPTKASLA